MLVEREAKMFELGSKDMCWLQDSLEEHSKHMDRNVQSRIFSYASEITRRSLLWHCWLGV